MVDGPKINQNRHHSIPQTHVQPTSALKLSCKTIAEATGDAFQPAQVTQGVVHGKYNLRSGVVSKKAPKDPHGMNKLAMKAIKHLAKLLPR